MTDNSKPRPHHRVLDALASRKCSFRVWNHGDFDVAIKSPGDFATVLGVDLNRVAKTVLLAEQGVTPSKRFASPQSHYCGVCISSNKRINFELVARSLGWKRCEMATAAELWALAEFPPGSVSPLGLGSMRILVDDDLNTLPSIWIGSGTLGVEVEIAPVVLSIVADAASAPLAQESKS